MDSVGLGQSQEEVKTEARKNRMACENCKKLTARCMQYALEIDALESRVDELEDEKQDILDNPEAHFDWGDLD